MSLVDFLRELDEEVQAVNSSDPEFNSEVRHSTIKQLTGETPPQAA